MTRSHKLSPLLTGLLLAIAVHTCGWAASPSLSHADLDQLLGQPMPAPIPKVVWAAAQPSQTNPPIYSVQSPRYDPQRLRALADFVGVRGEPVPMPDSLDIAPGYWIKSPHPTNSFLWSSVFFSERTGALGYGIPDNGYRWDIKNHTPMVQGVPTHAQALQKALQLLPVLGLTTNDLELAADGSPRRQFTKEVTGYNDYVTKEHKEMLQKRSVILFQRVPGGETISIGEGGALEVSFISQARLAEIQFLFRDIKPVAAARPMSPAQITDTLKRGKAWTFRTRLPQSLTITNCVVAYPQANSSYRQKFVWPVYSLTGFGSLDSQTNTFSLFIPMDRR